MIQIKIHRSLFGRNTPLEQGRMVGLVSMLEELRYNRTIDGDFNVYTSDSKENYSAIEVSDIKDFALTALHTNSLMQLESDEYGYIRTETEVNEVVPVEFPNSQTPVLIKEEIQIGEDENQNPIYETQLVPKLENGETVLRQKTWSEYTQVEEVKDGYFMRIGCTDKNNNLIRFDHEMYLLFMGKFGTEIINSNDVERIV